MNKSGLKSLITECVKEILKEYKDSDPSREEMISFLRTTPYKSEDGFLDSVEVAMYWIGHDFHGGQNSKLYSLLSTSPYKPGRLNDRGIDGEDDQLAKELYFELGLHFFPNEFDVEKHLTGYRNKDVNQVSETFNHLGEKEYNTFRGWVAAVKKIDPNAKFNGDKDIAGAMGSDGKHIGEWDGAVGSVIIKKQDTTQSEDKDPKKFLTFMKYLNDGPVDVLGSFDTSNPEPQIYKGYDLTKLWNSLVMKNGQEKSFDGDIDFQNTYKNYFSQGQIKEDGSSQPQESELKRTQTDFEGGKLPRGLTNPPIKSQVKTPLKAKDETKVLNLGQVVDVYFGKSPTRIYIFAEGKWWSLSITNATKYLSKFKPMPSMQSIEKMSDAGVVTTPLGTRVEPDGTGPNGEPSWLLVMGVI